MSVVTRLGLYGGPRGPWGPFSGKSNQDSTGVPTPYSTVFAASRYRFEFQADRTKFVVLANRKALQFDAERQS